MTKNFKVLQSKLVAVDTETTGLYPWAGDEPFIVSFCNEEGDTAYMEWDVDPFTRKVSPKKQDMKILQTFCADASISKIFHNAKFDIHMLTERLGLTVAGEIHDTTWLSHLYNSMEPTRKLKPLARKYVDFDMDDEEALKKGVNKLRRIASKLGWKIAYDETEAIAGNITRKAVTEADYWLPRAFQKLHPAVLTKSKVNGNLATIYAVKDVERTMLLYQFYMSGLQSRQEEFKEIYQAIVEAEDLDEAQRQYPTLMNMEERYEFERKLFPVLLKMERRGIRSDLRILDEERRRSREKWSSSLKELKSIAKKYGMSNLNPDKPAQLVKFFFERMKLKPHSYTEKRGQPQVNLDFLVINRDVPFVRALLRYRSAGKAYGSFFNRYKSFSRPDPLQRGSFALRTDYQQLGADTGRFSSKTPNLQNVADAGKTKALETISARSAFGPRKGYYWLSCDYKGQEIGIFADVAQEQFMLSAIREGRSIHTEIANSIWGGKDNETGVKQLGRTLVRYASEGLFELENQAFWKRYQVKDPSRVKLEQLEEISRDMMVKNQWDIVKTEATIGKESTRNRTKEVEFLKIYGGGVDAAVTIIGVPRDEAQELIDLFDEKFPRIPEYTRELIRQAKRDGFIINKYGRRLAIDPDFCYRCVNYIVQGSAADQLKTAMIRTDDHLVKSGVDGHVLLTCHDELIFEINEMDFTVKLVKELVGIMEDNQGIFCIPTGVDCSVAKETWNKKEKLKL